MSDSIRETAVPFTILYDSGGILAVDKPAGISVIPERNPGPTVLSRLEGYFSVKLFTVHRIDKDTSGVLLFARDAHIHAYLSGEFERRAVKKRYAAVVRGNVETDSGVIDSPLRQFGSGRMGIDAARGKPSRTVYEVRDRVSCFTLLDVFPETGRRHQIRVHLYSIGHPVAGDPLYGDGRRDDVPGMLLHALEVSFTDPSGRPVTISSPLPGVFRQFLSDCGQR